jgi:hypothetical protein
LAFSQELEPRPTRPSSTNFLSRVFQKLLAKVSIWHLTGRPGVISRARAKNYPFYKYELPISSNSKVISQRRSLEPFGPTGVSSKARSQAYPALRFELRSNGRSKVSWLGLTLPLFGPTRRFLRRSYHGLLGPQIRSPKLKLFKSLSPRSHFGTFRSHPAFPQELVSKTTRSSSTNFLSQVIQKL